MNETHIRPIRNEDDYAQALERIGALMDATPESWQMDELEVLAQLAELYEDKRWPIGAPSPAEATKFRMEQAELTPSDLEQYIGSSDDVCGVLSGERPLTLDMIRSLHKGLRISLEVLLGEPESITA